MLPLDTSVRAEYEDGYVLDETELEDRNPWGDGNVFTAILNRLPEAEHGRLARFSCFWKDTGYCVDWANLPDDARPVRLRHGYSTISRDGVVIESGWSGVDVGWETDAGREVLELR